MSAEQVDAAWIAGEQRFGHLPGRQFAKHGQDPLLGKLQVLSAGITEEAEPGVGIVDQPVGRWVSMARQAAVISAVSLTWAISWVPSCMVSLSP